MARIRTIKPEFFKHSGLFDAEIETGLPLRLAYAGLWICSDREGRFKWRPRELKLDALPFDDCDFSRVLDALESRGFLVRYEASGEVYGHIPTWKKHQFINNREAASELPEPQSFEGFDASATRDGRDASTSSTRLEGKGKEGDKGKGDDAWPDPSTGISPEMVCKEIMRECGLSGAPVYMAIKDQCRLEMDGGASADDTLRAMVAAYRDFEEAKPRLNYPAGAERFFGQMWRNRAGWPWKEGQSPKVQPIRANSQYELDAEAQREERRQRQAQLGAS